MSSLILQTSDTRTVSISFFKQCNPLNTTPEHEATTMLFVVAVPERRHEISQTVAWSDVNSVEKQIQRTIRIVAWLSSFACWTSWFSLSVFQSWDCFYLSSLLHLFVKITQHSVANASLFSLPHWLMREFSKGQPNVESYISNVFHVYSLRSRRFGLKPEQQNNQIDTTDLWGIWTNNHLQPSRGGRGAKRAQNQA